MLKIPTEFKGKREMQTEKRMIKEVDDDIRSSSKIIFLREKKKNGRK